jgi:pectate lyase
MFYKNIFGWIDQPIVNKDNCDIESQIKQENYYITMSRYEDSIHTSKQVIGMSPYSGSTHTDKPEIDISDNFFFDDISELPLPVGFRERSIMDKFTGFIRTSLNSSISSVNSAFNLLMLN